MTLKIMQEVTVWDIEYRQPNHVYLVSGDKIYAYSKLGQGKPEYLRTPLRFDRRGRKFVETKKNKWKFDLNIRTEQESELGQQPAGETWQVAGSKGNTYTVSLSNGRYSCTCQGYQFRSRCKHIQDIQP